MIVIPAVALASVVSVIALVVPVAIGVATWLANSLRAERTRRQQLYADAYAAVVSYCEFPYMIRRRRAPTAGHEEVAGEERLRIATALHDVQEKLSNFTAAIQGESANVSSKYDDLVSETRKIAGNYMREAWETPALNTDAGMNIDNITLTHLNAYRTAYLAAMKADLGWWRLLGLGR